MEIIKDSRGKPIPYAAFLKLKYKALLYKELLEWYYNNGVISSFTSLDQNLKKLQRN